MEGRNYKESSHIEFSSYGSGNSSTWDPFSFPPTSPYNQHYPSTPQHDLNQPSSGYGSQMPQPQRKLNRRFSRIADNYHSLDEVTYALSQAGLKSSNLIVGIDFTKSNKWTGSRSFNGRSLHGQNPYQQAISIIGQTLSAFDEDDLIPCYGFGDGNHTDLSIGYNQQNMILTASLLDYCHCHLYNWCKRCRACKKGDKGENKG